MKATSTALQAISAAPRQVVRALSTTAVARDAAPEPTTTSDHPSPSPIPSVSETTAASTSRAARVDAWTRSMSEVRDFRRRQQTIDSQVSLYLPPGIENPTRPSSSGPRDPTMAPSSSSAPTHREASISTLLAAGAALGHKKSIMHPAYLPFIYGNRAGLNVIDLDQTLSVLRRCASVVRDIVKDDGVVLFVSKQRNATLQIKGRMGDNGFVAASWMPGLLTNAETYFGIDPIMNGTYLPDLVIFSSPATNIGAIRECTMRKVPTMGVVDSNMDPRIVTYAIPANAASVRTSELVLGTLSLAGQEGRRMRLRELEQASLRKSRDLEWRRKYAKREHGQQGSEQEA